MKKLIGMAVVALMAVSTVHAEDSEPGNFGIGYQGYLFEEVFVINQMGLRWAPSPIGGALIIGHYSRDSKDGSSDSSMWMLNGKFFYNLIDRQRTDFYAGVKAGINYREYKPSSGSTEEDFLWSLGPLLGVEWRFEDVPEIGFNFEVGYDFSLERSDDPPNVDDTVYTGSYVSLGATYYF